MKKLIGSLLLASTSIAMASNLPPTPSAPGKPPAACYKKRGHIPPPCLVPAAPKK